jgi:hypothetical protein
VDPASEGCVARWTSRGELPLVKSTRRVHARLVSLARSAQYPGRNHRLTKHFREDCMQTTFNGLDGQHGERQRNGLVREV